MSIEILQRLQIMVTISYFLKGQICLGLLILMVFITNLEDEEGLKSSQMYCIKYTQFVTVENHPFHILNDITLRLSISETARLDTIPCKYIGLVERDSITGGRISPIRM